MGGSWRADEPSPQLHRCTHYTLCQTVRSYKTITPKMSAFGTSTPTTRPLGAVKPWALPTPAFATWQGCRRRLRQPLHPNHRALGRLQPVKAKPLRGCFASLDRFPAPSASGSFCYTQGDGKGSRATQSCISPLTPWNRPNTQPRGNVDRFCHMPCGLK